MRGGLNWFITTSTQRRNNKFRLSTHILPTAIDAFVDAQVQPRQYNRRIR